MTNNCKIITTETYYCNGHSADCDFSSADAYSDKFECIFRMNGCCTSEDAVSDIKQEQDNE